MSQRFVAFRNLTFAFLIGALTAVVVAFVYLNFIAPPRIFPSLSDGRYLGGIAWEDQRGKALPQSFYLQKKGGEYSVVFPAPLAESHSGSFVPLKEPERTSQSAPVLPIQIHTEVGDLLFFKGSSLGEEESPREQIQESGEVLDMGTGRAGRWVLSALPDPLVSPDGGEVAQPVALQLSLLLEERYVAGQLEEQQIEMQRLTQEIESLEEKLTQGDLLRAKGKEQLEAAERARGELLGKKQEALQQLGTLAEKLKLAREVTKYGEVIQLSRQVQELEQKLFLEEEDFLNLEIPEEEYRVEP
jgi:hypothetical protein